MTNDIFKGLKDNAYGVNAPCNDTDVEYWKCENCCEVVTGNEIIKLQDAGLYICLDCIHNTPLKNFEDETDNDFEQIMKLRINYEVECQKAELKNQKARDERYWEEFTNVINFRKKIYSAISDMDKTDLILRKRFLNNYN